jgi:Xaa-Pro dipeptidase
MATEALPDHPALRAGRRQRLFAAMAEHDLDVLVLGRVANIRYASGVPILWNAGTRPFGPGCVVVRDTEEVFLMSTWDEGVPEEIPRDHLFGITWNPMNHVKLLAGIAADAEPERVGTDATSPLFAQLLPMAFGEAEIVDGSAALRAARRTKTSEEVECIRGAVAVAESALVAALADLAPGRTERAITAVFMDAMASQGITTPSTQDVVRVTTSGADRAGGERVIRTGDLVTFDAGVVAEGYAGEVARTVVAGNGDGERAADSLFERADALWGELLDACRPGEPASGLLAAYGAAGEPLPTGAVARGLGLGFDDPVVTAALPATAAREQLDPGVVLVVTASVSDASIGTVTIREPIAITADGPEVLTRSPQRHIQPTGAAT